jgi:hypothetical protein
MPQRTVFTMARTTDLRSTARPRRRSLAFTLVEIVASIMVVGALSTIAYAGFQAVVNNNKDSAGEAELSQIARQANGDWVSSRKWTEAVVDASKEAGVQALFDAPDDPKPSLEIRTLSYRHVETRVGMAMRNDRGFCTMGLIENRAVKTWTVEEDLGANCAGRLALIGEQPPLAYTATTLPLGIPSDITAVGGRGQVVVSWTSTASSHQLYRDSTLIGPASSPYMDKNVKGGMTYAYSVRSVSPTGEYSPLVGPASALTAPDAPTNLTARYASGTLTVTWTASPGTVTGYRVYNDAGVQVWQGNSSPSALTTTVVPAYVTVRAYNATGESLDSDKAYLDAELSPPRELEVTGTTARSASLAWKAPATGRATGYNVYLDGVKTLSVKGLTATLTGLKPGKQYTAYVKAYTTGVESAASNEVTFKLNTNIGSSPDFEPPTLAFCSSNDPTAIRVTWKLPADDPDNPLQGFRVLVDGSETASAEARMPLTTAVVTGLTPGQVYSFTVQAWRTGGVSEPSAPATLMAGCLPDAPLSATLVVNPPSSATAQLTVPAVARPAIDYFEYNCVSYRPTPSSTLGVAVTTTSPIGSATPGSKINTSITGLSVGSRYGCYVRAHSPLGFSSKRAPLTETETALNDGVQELPSPPCAIPSNQVDPTAAPTNPQPGCYFITILPPAAPAAPTLTKGDGELPVSWPAVASTEVRPVDGYRVYITANRPTKCISADATPCLKEQSNVSASCVTTATACTITGLTNGTTYTVYVQTFNTAFSNDGASTSRLLIGVPATPAAPTLSGQTTTCINVTGSATSTTGRPVSGYIIFRSGTNIATVSSSQNDCSRTAGTQYCYTTKAYNGDWESATSPQACTYTRQNAPAVSATMGVNGVNASWTAVSGAERYEHYLTNVTGWGNDTDTSHTFSGLSECAWYTVNVRAYASTWGYTDAGSTTQRSYCRPAKTQELKYSSATVTMDSSDVWRYDFCKQWNPTTEKYVTITPCTAGWRGWGAENGGGSTWVGRSGLFGWDRFYSPTERRFHYAVGFNFNSYTVGGTVASGTTNAAGQDIGGVAVSADATTLKSCRVRIWPSGQQAINAGGAYAWEFAGGTAELHTHYHNDGGAFDSENSPPSRFGHRVTSLSTTSTSSASDDDGESTAIATLWGDKNGSGVDDCGAWKDKTNKGLLIAPVNAPNSQAPQQTSTYAGTSSGGSSVSRAGWVALQNANNGSRYVFSPRLKFDRWFTHTYYVYE